MRLYGRLEQAPEFRMTQDPEKKLASFTLVMNLEKRLTVEVEIPWELAKQVANGMMSLMKDAEAGKAFRP